MSVPNLLPLLMFAVTLMNGQDQEHQTLAGLEHSLREKISRAGGTFAVAFKNLTTGDSLSINETETFHAASTMKTAVMIEVFKQAAEGKFRLSDSLEMVNQFRSIADSSFFLLDPKEDGDPDLYRRIGERISIRELVERMIVKSSNLATNALIEFVHAEAVTRTMNEIGATKLKVLRGVEDGKAFRAGLINTTTAYDLLRVFELLASKGIVTPETREEMIAILLRQESRDMIPALLPENVKVAHKTGSITGVEHDSGLVMLPDGREYVLVMLSKDLKENKVGIQTIAEMSKLVYDYEVGR